MKSKSKHNYSQKSLLVLQVFYDWHLKASANHRSSPWPSRSPGPCRWWWAACTNTPMTPRRGSLAASQHSRAWWPLSTSSAWRARQWTWCFQWISVGPCLWRLPTLLEAGHAPSPVWSKGDIIEWFPWKLSTKSLFARSEQVLYYLLCAKNALIEHEISCHAQVIPGSHTDAAESSSFCFLSNTTSSTLSFSNSFWQRFSSTLRKFTVVLGLSVMGTLSWRLTTDKVETKS